MRKGIWLDKEFDQDQGFAAFEPKEKVTPEHKKNSAMMAFKALAGDIATKSKEKTLAS